MTGDATEPTWNGYLLTVACACGAVFERWVGKATVLKTGCPKGAAEGADCTKGWRVNSAYAYNFTYYLGDKKCKAQGQAANRDAAYGAI
jgi:hypothetical protein